MKYLQKILIVLSLHLGASPLLLAQIVYKIAPSEMSAAKLSGTSTLHDWTMSAQEVQGNGQFEFVGKKLQRIGKLSFVLPVQNLKSAEKMMDKNAYKALKSDEFKNISFILTNATVGASENNNYPVKALGNLSIAGVTKPVSIQISCQVLDDKTIVCVGKEKLKMTDYHVKPPTFLFGEMKTGDDLVIDLNLVFKN